MRRRPLVPALLLGALTAGLVLAGCGDAETLETGEVSEAVLTTPAPSEAEACGGNVFLGASTMGFCPGPQFQSNFGSWTAAPLFPNAPEPTLARYCKYTWTPLASAPPDFSPIPDMNGAPAADWLDAECGVVAPLATLTETRDSVRVEMSKHARVQNGGTTLPKGQSARGGVRVLVVDTSPTTVPGAPLPVLGRDEHGYAMARLIQDLSCSPGASCPVQVLTQLGLPQKIGGAEDRVHGGHYGSMHHLATAIEAGVRGWMGLPAKSRPQLIINLSVGWDGAFGGDVDSPKQLLSDRTGARAVYDSMVFAYCAGALMIAAAGNDGGGTVRPTGAMFPGGWERFPAPTPAQCQALGAGFSGGWDGTGYAPLLYAVGAVDAEDLAVVNARTGGMPRMVAAGQAVVAHVPVGTQLVRPVTGPDTVTVATGTAPRTGSSVATAAVSAAAAAAWSYLPTLKREDLMQVLYETAPVIDGAAGFCLGEPCPSVRRLDLCQAVALACTGAPTRCDVVPPSCSSIAAGDGTRFQLPTAQRLMLEGAYTGTAPLLRTMVGAPVSEAFCGGISRGAAGFSLADNPCLDRQHFADSRVPFVNPQPGSQGDPDLPVAIFDEHDGSWVMEVYVSRNALRTYQLEQSSVIITSRSGARSIYGLGDTIPGGEGRMRFQFGVDIAPSDVADVSLAFTTTLPGSSRVTSIVSPAIVGTR